MPNWRSEINQRLACLQLAPACEFAQDLDDCYAELLSSGGLKRTPNAKPARN